MKIRGYNSILLGIGVAAMLYSYIIAPIYLVEVYFSFI